MRDSFLIEKNKQTNQTNNWKLSIFLILAEIRTKLYIYNMYIICKIYMHNEFPTETFLLTF